MDKHPSETCDDFQDERLHFLAELFARCRDQALDLYRPDEGENPWDLGCRCYSRITWALEHAAASGEQPWLTILQPRIPGKQFIFRVGKQPVRFYTGNSSRPSPRSLICEHTELRELSLALGDADGTKATDWIWRIAIGVDHTSKVAQVTLLQVTRSNGSVRNPYSIPFSRNPLGNVVEMLPTGIEIDLPEVGTWDEEDEVKDAGAGGAA